jgi:hypothetical protein
MNHVTTHIVAHTASPVIAHDRRVKVALVHVGFAVAALVCLLTSRPGLASESIVANASRAGVSSLRVQDNGGEGIRVPTAAFALASANVDGFQRQAAFVPAPLGTEAVSQDRGAETTGQGRHESVADERHLASASSVVEPATIAVLGFTVAALLAVRRRKNAAAEAVAE